MSHFIAFFPPSETSSFPEAELQAVGQLWQDVFQAQDARIREHRGFGFLTADFGSAGPIRVCFNDDGCAVIKGVMFDVRSDKPAVEPPELLREFVETGRLDRDRYEGTFVAALWDAKRRKGMLLNDQAATLNAYYGAFPQGLFAATHALSLARVLHLPLAAESVCEFLTRGQLTSPDTMFRGLKRLDVGEELSYEGGAAAVNRYWLPYAETAYSTIPRAAEAIEGALVDRVRRYARGRQPILCDLTGGYDSRLVVCGCDRAGVDYATTVNGDLANEEVAISKTIADKTGRPWIHFNPRDCWNVAIDERMRRELLYRMDARLVFASAYHHLLSRPLLAQTYPLHFIGGHGDVLRYFPWGQEFLGIGKRRLANIPRLLRYRFLQDGFPPRALFDRQWRPAFLSRLHARAEAVCRLVPDTTTTQQLDAACLWRATGHYAAFMSAVWDWLPSTTPLATAGFLNAAFATSWRIKVTSGLIRRIMNDLSPDIAHVKTSYGGTGAPPTWKTFHREIVQCSRQAMHLFDKIDQIALKGRLRASFHQKTPARVHKPYLTPEFRSEMTLDRFRSRRMYNKETLAAMLNGTDDAWYANEILMLKIATLELLCRELDFEPDADFLPNAS